MTEGHMKKVLIVLFAGLVLTLTISGVALAASPQDIYDDWVAHGTLTQTYTTQELQAYLNDPVVHGYGDTSVLVPLDSYVNSLINKGGRSTFPWTGAQIAAMIAAAALLITLGVVLRRSGRRKPQERE
jgi:hypothetical protein